MSYKKVRQGNMKRTSSPARRQTSSGSSQASGSSKKRGSGSGKTVLLAIAAVILVVMLGSTITGFIFSPSKGECREIISDFQTSCNELNVNGIVGTLKPSIANPLKIALGITGIVTDTPTNEMLENILGALGGFGGLTDKTGLSVSDLFKMMEIKAQSFGFPGKTRKVKCKVSVGGLEQKIYISVTKQDGDVYISKVSLKK